MRRYVFALCILPFSASLLGQKLQTVSYETAKPQQQEPVATFRANTRLVVVDVVVQDKNKQPVHGLKAEDFSLLEDGARQTLRSFEEHTALADDHASPSAQAEAAANLPPGTFSNKTLALSGGPLNVLLLDRLNTPGQDQVEMQRQIEEYLATSRKGERLAIFGLTDRLILLQGFTDDPELLRAAVTKGGIHISPLREERMGGLGNSESLKPSDKVAIQATGREEEGVIAQMKIFEAQNASGQLQVRIQNTLDSLNALARYLAAFPGRKNLIWFSGSFPVDIMPDLDRSATQEAFLGIGSKDTEFNETTALLSRSQVAVYPIDARGMTNISTISAADISTGTGLKGRATVGNVTLEQTLNKFAENTADEHSVMLALASDTGGKAAMNTNGLKDAVAAAIADGANYYTLAYDPGDKNWNSKLRHIEVKLKEQGYSLSYRKGYFADDPNALGSAKSSLASATPVSRAMIQALSHASPIPTQVTFTARVLPVSAATEASVAPNNKAGERAKGPFRRYQVSFSIDPHAVHFTQTADGNRHETLEFVIHVYNNNGELIDSVGKSIQANVPAAAYEQFERSGIPYQLEVSVPAKGEYSLRVVMHDVEADRVGAIELPVASVSGLQPLEASAAGAGR